MDLKLTDDNCTDRHSVLQQTHKRENFMDTPEVCDIYIDTPACFFRKLHKDPWTIICRRLYCCARTSFMTNVEEENVMKQKRSNVRTKERREAACTTKQTLENFGPRTFV